MPNYASRGRLTPPEMMKVRSWIFIFVGLRGEGGSKCLIEVLLLCAVVSALETESAYAEARGSPRVLHLKLSNAFYSCRIGT